MLGWSPWEPLGALSFSVLGINRCSRHANNYGGGNGSGYQTFSGLFLNLTAGGSQAKYGTGYPVLTREGQRESKDPKQGTTRPKTKKKRVSSSGKIPNHKNTWDRDIFRSGGILHLSLLYDDRLLPFPKQGSHVVNLLQAFERPLPVNVNCLPGP